MASREQYYQFKAEGNCVNCGCRPHIENSVRCDKCQEQQVRYRLRNTLQRKTRQQAQHLQRKRIALEAYGGLLCTCCGETHLELLTLDHANGDGAQMRKKVGKNIYWWLQRNNFPQDLGLRVLCFNCNCSLGFNGYCPHELQHQAEYRRSVS